MGIPKFYRWLSERYPLLNQPIKNNGVPEVDGLYLDMNGIIHNCTHGNDSSLSKMPEEQMILKVFTYLDRLFHMIKPKRVIFMAIDGVAPRAKMNQQRSRRFKAARDARVAAEEAEAKGEAADPDRFDSNCITPGTPFMERLSAHLKFFIRKRIADDPAWRGPRVVFSGHECPGEGEHKIMEFLRLERLSQDYKPNRRHVMYGLDADLVMLSLVTHEPHFCLLREVVTYGAGGKGQPSREVLTDPTDDHFLLFHIGLLREYLEIEFRPTTPLPFDYDPERIVDDFVLFCMLVGNDFLPALPTLDIGEGGLNTLFRLYKELLPEMGGYLTMSGTLHRGRAEMLLQKFGELELEILKRRAEDAEDFAAKMAKRGGRGGRGAPGGTLSQLDGVGGRGDDFDAMYQKAISGGGAPGGSNGKRGPGGRPFNPPGPSGPKPPSSVPSFGMFAALDSEGADEDGVEGVELEAPAPTEEETPFFPPPTDDSDPLVGEIEAAAPEEGATMMSRAVRAMWLNGDATEAYAAFRERWYADKLKVSADGVGIRSVVEAYVQGLHWVLEYYYRGVASWDWFYPFHYAPLASDMVALSDFHVAFNQGQPSTMYQQLLAVLPPYSAKLLPEPYRGLMCAPNSPVKDFYPEEFEVDLEGKRADWEGVVLIPFIETKRLFAAEAKYVPPSRLTEQERARNKIGEVLVFEALPAAAALPIGAAEHCTSTVPDHLGPVVQCNSRLVRLPVPPPLREDQQGFEGKLSAGTKTGRHAPPGFPTLRTLPVSPEPKMAGVNIFGTPARGESLMLRVGEQEALRGVGAGDVARLFLGKRCYYSWPYLKEGLVSAVSDARGRVEAGDSSAPPGEVPPGRAWEGREAEQWRSDVTMTCQDMATKKGVVVDPPQCPILLHLRPLEGLVRHVDGSVERRYGKDPVLVPVQVTLQRHPNPDPRTLGLGLGSAQEGMKELASLFKEGSQAAFIGRSYYGCTATVLGPDPLNEGFLRISLLPPDPTSQSVERTALRVLTSVTAPTLPAYAVAKKANMSVRALSMLTGSVFVRHGAGRDDKLDVGLNVKSGAKGLYVPDFAQPTPDGLGWTYTAALQRAVEAYRSRFPWLIQAIEGRGEKELTVKDLFPPETTVDAALKQLQGVKDWVKTTPLGKRPLVKTGAQVACEEAVRRLQASLPPLSSAVPTPVHLERVSAALLLPPVDRAAQAISPLFVAGHASTFGLADRVIHVGGTGQPPFGLRGTVVAVHEGGAFLECLMDREFEGGTDLYGRCLGKAGAVLPAAALLNLSKPAATPVPKEMLPKQVTKPAWGAAAGPVMVPGGSLAEVEARIRTEAALSRDPRNLIGDVLKALDGKGDDLAAPQPPRGQSARAAAPQPPPPQVFPTPPPPQNPQTPKPQPRAPVIAVVTRNPAPPAPPAATNGSGGHPAPPAPSPVVAVVSRPAAPPPGPDSASATQGPAEPGPKNKKKGPARVITVTVPQGNPAATAVRPIAPAPAPAAQAPGGESGADAGRRLLAIVRNSGAGPGAGQANGSGAAAQPAEGKYASAERPRPPRQDSAPAPPPLPVTLLGGRSAAAPSGTHPLMAALQRGTVPTAPPPASAPYPGPHGPPPPHMGPYGHPMPPPHFFPHPGFPPPPHMMGPPPTMQPQPAPPAAGPNAGADLLRALIAPKPLRAKPAAGAGPAAAKAQPAAASPPTSYEAADEGDSWKVREGMTIVDLAKVSLGSGAPASGGQAQTQAAAAARAPPPDVVGARVARVTNAAEAFFQLAQQSQGGR